MNKQETVHSKPIAITYPVVRNFRTTMIGLARRIIIKTYNDVKGSYTRDIGATGLDGDIDEDLYMIRQKRYEYELLWREEGEEAVAKLLAKLLKNSSLSVERALKEIRPEKKAVFPVPEVVEYERPNDFYTTQWALKKNEPLNPRMKNILKASFAGNMTIFNQIMSDYFAKVDGIISRGVQNGATLSQIKEEMHALGNQTLRRVSDVAEDQAYKDFTSMIVQQGKEQGVKKFMWVHTYKGKRPRLFHKNVLNGKIFDIDNPPIIEPKTGIRGYPAQLPYCRCQMSFVNI